jgi:hypothetical protein
MTSRCARRVPVRQKALASVGAARRIAKLSASARRTFPGDVCEFGVLVGPIRSRGHQVTFPEDTDGTIQQRITGQLIVRLTNTTSGESVVRNITGPVDFWFFADGTAASLNRGHALAFLFFFEEGGPALWYHSGSILWAVDTDGNFSVVRQPGISEDLCQTLA